MELLGYAAFGGLERIAIIMAALVVGYWGYRLYIGDKSAGLAFMAIACVVLLGALLTGGNHVKSVGESLQLASTEAREVTPPDTVERVIEHGADTAPLPALRDSATATPLMAEQPVSAEPAPAPIARLPLPASPAPDTIDAADGPDEQAEADLEAQLADADVAIAMDRLATAQELGGRIVSVKSDKVSLEWTSAPAN